MQEPDYSISTPENVDLHLEIAGIGNRLIAQIIDNLLIMAIIIVLVIMAVIAGFAAYKLSPDKSAASVVIGILALCTILAATLVQLGYFVICEALGHGQTPGKKVAGIRTIEANGLPVGWIASLIRNILRGIDATMLIGLLVAILNRNEKRIGDYAAGTLVVRERKADIGVKSIKITAGGQVDDTLDVGRMLPAEYDLLADFLRRRQYLNKHKRPELAAQLAGHFKNAYSSQSDGEKYLETLFLTYQARSE